QAAVAALKVVRRTRDHVADVDRLAGLRIGDQAVVGGFVLQVEHGSHALGGAGEGGMRRYIGGAFVADPYLAAVVQSPPQLRSSPGRHGGPRPDRRLAGCLICDGRQSGEAAHVATGMPPASLPPPPPMPSFARPKWITRAPLKARRSVPPCRLGWMRGRPR